MSGFELWPEIGSLLAGAVVSGIGGHLNRKRLADQGVPMAQRSIQDSILCSYCGEAAVGMDTARGTYVCERHYNRAVASNQQTTPRPQDMHPARRPAPAPRPQPVPVQRPPQPFVQDRAASIDPYDAQTVRSSRYQQEGPRAVRDWRQDEFEYDDEDYLDEEEFYDEEEDLCPHNLDPARCRRCYESMQRALQRPVPQQSPAPRPQRPSQRPAQPQRPERRPARQARRVNRGGQPKPLPPQRQRGAQW